MPAAGAAPALNGFAAVASANVTRWPRPCSSLKPKPRPPPPPPPTSAALPCFLPCRLAPPLAPLPPLLALLWSSKPLPGFPRPLPARPNPEARPPLAPPAEGNGWLVGEVEARGWRGNCKGVSKSSLSTLGYAGQGTRCVVRLATNVLAAASPKGEEAAVGGPNMVGLAPAASVGRMVGVRLASEDPTKGCSLSNPPQPSDYFTSSGAALDWFGHMQTTYEKR